MTIELVPKNRSWEAKLILDFCIEKRSCNDNRTVIASRQHHGPLVIQKPFYPEGDPCHIYLLHPPGGLVGGDRLTLDVNLQKNSHVLMTTPGAAKFYRSDDQTASQLQRFNLEDNALLEWMPQETIVFDQANARVETEVRLKPGAKFIGWDISCLGRPAGNQPFTNGQFVQKIQLHSNNRPLVIERALYRGKALILSAPWGLANHTTVGTMFITPANKRLVEVIRKQVHTDSPELFSVTLLDSVIVCRYLGSQAATAKKLFTQIWEIARPAIQNMRACMPRIWKT